MTFYRAAGYPNVHRLGRRIAVFGLCVLLQACDDTTPAQHLERAKNDLGANELGRAQIELRNALKKDGQHAEARFLLGRTYEAMGNFPAALPELERAMDLGYDKSELLPPLLRSKLGLKRHAEVIGELADQPSLAPGLQAVLASAYLQAGEPDRAHALFTAAVALDPELSDAELGLALYSMLQHDSQAARRHVERAVEIDPFSRRAWLMKGELELGEERFDAAAAAFETAKDIPDSSLIAYINIARVYLMSGDLDAADAELDTLVRIAPQFLLAHYLKGLVAFQRKDYAAAEQHLQKVQAQASEHPPTLQLMGTVKFALGQTSQAESNFTRFLATSPANVSVRKLLANLRYQDGRHELALEALLPIADTTNDPQVYAMLGVLYQEAGDAVLATESLNRAIAIDPSGSGYRKALAVSLLAAGDSAGAVSQLRTVVDMDGQSGDDVQSGQYLLALAHIRQGKPQQAIGIADAMLAESPDDPMAQNLRGGAYLAMDDREQAIAAFEAALSADPAFTPALENLVRLYVMDGETDAAKQRLQATLDVEAESLSGLLGLARLWSRDDPQRAIDLLVKANTAHPDELAPRVALAEVYLSVGNFRESSKWSDAALRLARTNVRALALAADAALAGGDGKKGRQHVSELERFLGDGELQPALHTKLGILHRRVGNNLDARRHLAAALEKSDDSDIDALISMAQLDIADRRFERAAELIDAAQSNGAPPEASTHLRVDLARATGDVGQARQLLTPLVENGDRTAVLKMAFVERDGGSMERGKALLEEWIADNPKDLTAQLSLIQLVMESGDTSSATAQYESMRDQSNPVVLNNLAWLYQESGDLEKALEAAQQALTLAPGSGEILDTLGWILVKLGRPEQAVSFLEDAALGLPGNPSVQYHLGHAYAQVSRTDGARRAFMQALRVDVFPERELAEAEFEAL